MISQLARTRTAIITGASSVIGLELTQHLLKSPQWRVVLANRSQVSYDSISSTLDPDRHIFIPTDVSSWPSQLNLFKRAYDWSNGRIDFFAANAGIIDQEGVSQPFDLDSDPEKPNLACVETDFLGAFYGLKLFIHFSRKTKRDYKGFFNPKMVITASSAAIYGTPIMPHYSAAKHGCLGLVKSAAPSLMKYDNIALNTIMPGFVQTDIMMPGVLDRWPKEYITPMSTVLRAFDELIDEDGKVVPDGKSDGKDKVVKSGCAVECSVKDLYYREELPPADRSQAFVVRQSYEHGIFGVAVAEIMTAATAGKA